jgi:hypothetical protein
MMKSHGDVLVREGLRRLIAELAGGCEYENTVIAAIAKAGASGKIKRGACADASVADADIKVAGKIYNIEVKADGRAQMGGSSIGYDVATREFKCGADCHDMSATVIDVLKASPAGEELKDSLDRLVRFISKRTNDRDLRGFPMSGFTDETWALAVERGLVRPINRSIDADVSAIEGHYAHKGTHYIQIGGAGLFRLGEADPAGLGVPVLHGTVKLELRAAKAGASASRAKAGLRVQARLAVGGNSTHTLDDPASIRDLLTSLTAAPKAQ